MTTRVDRRSVLGGIAVLLGGCATQGGFGPGFGFYPLGNPEFAAYGPRLDHGHEIPGLDLTRIDPSLLRQQVAFAGPYRPGTIVVNIGERRLYLVQPGGVAMRYAVGVGREEALNFRGSAVIGRKAEWPHWTPTSDMIRRMPIYAHYANGLPGGIDNPLGARALYLYRGNQDTDSGCTEPSNRRRSAPRCRAAASACSITTSSISTTAFRSARRSSCCRRGSRCAPKPGWRRAAITIPTDRSGPDPTRDRRELTPAHTTVRRRPGDNNWPPEALRSPTLFPVLPT
jgi:L,D-transpeptidase catalytic domain